MSLLMLLSLLSSSRNSQVWTFTASRRGEDRLELPWKPSTVQKGSEPQHDARHRKNPRSGSKWGVDCTAITIWNAMDEAWIQPVWTDLRPRAQHDTLTVQSFCDRFTMRSVVSWASSIMELVRIKSQRYTRYHPITSSFGSRSVC